jgi:hypothetical protein
MEPLGKLLVGAGLLIAAVGLGLWLGGGRERGGLLPGDVFVARGSFKFYFPIATCIVISLILSFLFWLFRK